MQWHWVTVGQFSFCMPFFRLTSYSFSIIREGQNQTNHCVQKIATGTIVYCLDLQNKHIWQETTKLQRTKLLLMKFAWAMKWQWCLLTFLLRLRLQHVLLPDLRTKTTKTAKKKKKKKWHSVTELINFVAQILNAYNKFQEGKLE